MARYPSRRKRAEVPFKTGKSRIVNVMAAERTRRLSRVSSRCHPERLSLRLSRSAPRRLLALRLNQINDREQNDPDQIDEMPVETDRLDPLVAGLGVLAQKRFSRHEGHA